MITLLFTILFTTDIQPLMLRNHVPITERHCVQENFSNFDTWLIADSIISNDHLRSKYNRILTMNRSQRDKENAIFDLINSYISLFPEISIYRIYISELTNLYFRC